MTERDRERLIGVHPDLSRRVHQILNIMEQFQHPMFVVSGVRTAAEQAVLFAQGRSKPGAIVTNADGIRRKSNHQTKADGWGHAVDLAFVGPKPFADEHPWDAYGLLAQALGLAWGGGWAKFPDRPHLEWPESDSKELKA